MATNRTLHDVFVTALEGGIGYWSVAAAYHWANNDESDDVDGFFADIVDQEAHEDEQSQYRINGKVIQDGLNAITSGDVKVPAAYRAEVFLIDVDDDRANLDAELADIIVQAGLFGEVIYG